MSFKFGYKYDLYINRPNQKTIEEVDTPKRYNGKVLTDFDDYETEVVEEILGRGQHAY